MNAIETLRQLNTEYQAQKARISQLTLSQWLQLAAELNVAKNDRDEAAAILARRTLSR